MNSKERLLLILFFLMGFGFLALDVVEDLKEGVGYLHVVEELFILVSMIGLFGYIWTKFLKEKKISRTTKKELIESSKQVDRYRNEAKYLAEGIRNKVEAQMMSWNLTKTEREISFLLLKGLSSKEIASVQDISEATVRQHLNHIYKKTGMKNRSIFLSYFLEDLFFGVEA